MSTIAENLEAVHERIAAAAARAGRDPADVRLMAVSKTKPPNLVREALAAGQTLFGENYVQEALDKIEAVGPGAQWHMIGHLQRNKTRFIPGAFAAVESLDSERLARALDKQAQEAGTVLDVYAQLNLTGEATKSGLHDADDLRRLAEALRGMPGLRLRGLMTIPDPDLDEQATRALYARVREMHEALRAEFALGETFNELSLGMSHDFEWAIAEGSTLVRVGTAIFGARS